MVQNCCMDLMVLLCNYGSLTVYIKHISKLTWAWFQGRKFWYISWRRSHKAWSLCLWLCNSVGHAIDRMLKPRVHGHIAPPPPWNPKHATCKRDRAGTIGARHHRITWCAVDERFHPCSSTFPNTFLDAPMGERSLNNTAIGIIDWMTHICRIQSSQRRSIDLTASYNIHGQRAGEVTFDVTRCQFNHLSLPTSIHHSVGMQNKACICK